MSSPMHYGISQSVIDVVGFGGANYILHKASPSHMPKPTMPKVVIFGLSDLAIRNGWINWMSKVDPFSSIQSGNARLNGNIALTSFALATLLDLARGHEFGKSAINNLILNAVGFGSNELLDRFIVSKDYV